MATGATEAQAQSGQAQSGQAQSGQAQSGQALSGQAHAVGIRPAGRAEPDAPAVAPGDPDRPADQPRRRADRPGGYEPGPLWARWLPPVVGFLISLWGITSPSFWRDEAATIAAIKRPLGDLITMLGNVDAVHGAYYLMMWPIEHVLGPGELVLRLPSAAAVARSYGMVMTVAAIASYLLVRTLGAEPDKQRRWLAGYAASIAALGILNIFGLLLVPAHAVTMALICRRGLREQAPRRLAFGWLTAIAAGLVVASPLLILGYKQRGQIAWLGVNTSSSGLNTLFSLSGSYLVTTTLLIVIAVAAVLSTEVSRAKREAAWPWRLAQLSLPWLIVPPFLLLIGSVVTPVYTSRYILICIPPLALIGGAAIASYGRRAGTIALGLVLLSGATTQLGQRTEAGHYDDILAVDQIVAANVKPGDVVLYPNPNAESFGAAYSYGLGKLRNVALKQGPVASGTLAGVNAPIAEIRSRLRHAKRVWVVEINSLSSAPVLLGLNGLPISLTPVMNGLPLQFTAYWHERGDYLVLFTRT